MKGLARRAWTGLLWLLGWPQPPPVLPTRMTAEDVAALARAAAATAGVPFHPMAPHVYRTDGKLLWRVDSATVGRGWRVEVDDATGAAGPVTWWGHGN